MIDTVENIHETVEKMNEMFKQNEEYEKLHENDDFSYLYDEDEE